METGTSKIWEQAGSVETYVRVDVAVLNPYQGQDRQAGNSGRVSVLQPWDLIVSLGNLFFFKKKFKYSWFMIFYKFQVYNTVIHNLWRLYSIYTYCKILAKFPVVQYILGAYFIHSNLYLSIPSTYAALLP